MPATNESLRILPQIVGTEAADSKIIHIQRVVNGLVPAVSPSKNEFPFQNSFIMQYRKAARLRNSSLAK